MKGLVIPSLLLLFMAAEVLFWVSNPLHIPATFFPARAFGFQVFEELGPSMEPTVLPNRYVFVSSWPYLKSSPRIGDVVAFAYPRNPMIADLKRVIATSGSTIEIRNGVTYIDGKPYLETYLRSPSRHGEFMREVRIPRGAYFVMGDNREQSEDSRSYGVVMRDRIVGKRWP